MSIHLKLFLAFSVVVALAVGATFYGNRAVSEAGSLVVRLYDQPFMAVSRARAAQARFSDAYASMEHALALRETGQAAAREQLQTAVNDVLAELKIVSERGGTSDMASVANAERLARNW